MTKLTNSLGRSDSRQISAGWDLLLLLILNLAVVFDQGSFQSIDLNWALIVLIVLGVEVFVWIHRQKIWQVMICFTIFVGILLEMCWIRYMGLVKFLYLSQIVGPMFEIKFFTTLFVISCVLLRVFVLGYAAYFIIHSRSSPYDYVGFFDTIGIPVFISHLMIIACLNLFELQQDFRQLSLLYDQRTIVLSQSPHAKSSISLALRQFIDSMKFLITKYFYLLSIILDMWLQKSRKRTEIIESRLCSYHICRRQHRTSFRHKDLQKINLWNCLGGLTLLGFCFWTLLVLF